MRITLLSIALALLVGVLVHQKTNEPSLSVAAPQPPQSAVAAKPAPAETIDVAAVEVTEGEGKLDPCDLSGYDLSKMTVDLHEKLVEACERTKQ